MNKGLIFCMVASIALAFTGCSHTPKDDGLAHDHQHEHEHEHEHGEEHEHGADEITLEAATAERLGVATTVLEPSTFNDAIKVSGKLSQGSADQSVVATTAAGILTFKPGIVDGASVKAGQVIATISSKGMAGGDANAAAKAALDAAKREVDRLTPLHNEGIVSTRDYNAAVAAYEQARAAYSGTPSGGVAKAATSGIITSLNAATGQYVDAGQAIATVGSSKSLLLQADVPSSQSAFLSKITSAKLRVPGSENTIALDDVGGRLLNYSTASTQGGYIPVYFAIDNPGDLIPGTSVEVYLLGDGRSDALVVPRTAIVEQQGAHFAYIKLDEDCYKKSPVTLGNSDGEFVEILSGLQPGEEVVTSGATMIKLAESSGAVPEGHSHQH